MDGKEIGTWIKVVGEDLIGFVRDVTAGTVFYSTFKVG